MVILGMIIIIIIIYVLVMLGDPYGNLHRRGRGECAMG